MGYNYTVAGVDSVIARFLEVPEVAHEALGNALEDGLRDIQYSAGDFVAVDTGNGRATLLDPAAVKVDRETLRGEFGLITPELCLLSSGELRRTPLAASASRACTAGASASARSRAPFRRGRQSRL
jgi:hypothetical protein